MGQKRNGVTPSITRDGRSYPAFQCRVCHAKSTDPYDVLRCEKHHVLMDYDLAGKLRKQRGWVFNQAKRIRSMDLMKCKDCGEEVPGRNSARSRCTICAQKYYAKLRLSRPSWRNRPK